MEHKEKVKSGKNDVFCIFGKCTECKRMYANHIDTNFSKYISEDQRNSDRRVKYNKEKLDR